MFHRVSELPVPSLLRGSSAPVKLGYGYSDEQLMFLMARGGSWQSWDAARATDPAGDTARGQDYRGLLKWMSRTAVAAIHAALSSQDAEPALIAEVLSLPSIGYLGDFMPVVDIDALHLARETLRVAVGTRLGSELLALYRRLEDNEPYRPVPEQIGRRSLKNRALGYLVAAGGTAGGDLCEAQYRRQHNMTDVMAAMGLLADSGHPARDGVLADFEARWRNDPLVMDKWFAVQAMADRPDVLTEVNHLMQHPAFSMRNPNKVRALIGSFTGANPVRFHAADGSGYEFLGEQVLALDSANPQIAARLLRAMARWQRYDEARQARMRAVLERIVAARVSKDVYEIATKSLGRE
ncbi:MAG: aminopeptidase N C-terminal domain-containing protein [Chromatiaceae bacterium]|nr:aminopeptidase N C-terminal domain-containing protein [Chromatiaceae bacterium]